mmetsp:Transcript_39282/g.84714  ORF Transcript_39282/g.84714 Transcript_39282/m.84714 type:complete len:1054 (+) Transcript_39282:120-3281(+)
MMVNTMLQIAHAPVVLPTRKTRPLHTVSCGTPTSSQPPGYDDDCISDGSIGSSGREMQRKRLNGGLQIGEAVRSSSSSSSSPQMERVEPQSEGENSLGSTTDHEKILCNRPDENIMQSHFLLKDHTQSNERDGSVRQPLNLTTRQQMKYSSTYLHMILLLLLLPITLTNGQQSNNNPNNKYCGVNYKEAHLFCHLPPEQSLPCPNGSDEDCPYGMPCWEIREECTPPPTPEPTPYPTSSPVARRSTDAGDHNFCGLGFTNLFGCAVNCPNGSPAECPSGQLCYFNTPCDARVEGIRLGEPTRTPTRRPTQKPTISPKPTERVDTGLPDGRRNFCGMTVGDATQNCHRDRHCPSGLNNDCPPGMSCWVDVQGCNIYELPSMRPTISFKPTPPPTPYPTTRDPSWTYEPTNSPLDKDDIRNFFFCGTSWGDASSRCYQRCLSGHHSDCPGDEECFAQAACKKLIKDQPSSLSDDGDDESKEESLLNTPSGEDTPEPTSSPLEKDDYRNFFFCGTTWSDASTRCYQRCPSGLHVDCPADEECFAQANCKNGVIVPKTSRPTTPPTLDGTRSPTISPAPTNPPTEPQPTHSPVYEPSSSPALVPTENPTTPFPTNHPTYAPCAGEPCSNKEHCRSNQNFCGPGKYYCNEKSIWEASCGVPTDPPMSLAPTTIWPSSSPTTSSEPTQTKTPTVRPTRAADVVYYLNTDRPTAKSKPGWRTPRPTNRPGGNNEEDGGDTTPRPTFANVDYEYYGPDDPLGTFFCGIDWNHAISECPHRCPSGEASQCPNGWACYAFTPCVGLGVNTPPTAKPTWEPTKKPTPIPTTMPTTAREYWNQQNADLNAKATPQTNNQKPTKKPVWWTPAPSPKPTYSPTKDQCRGLPCDYEGECRSRLGFCGTGIVYCNSASSWKASCGGGAMDMIRLDDESDDGGNGGPPTMGPSTLWEAWVEGENAKNDSDNSEDDASGDGDSSDADSEDADSSEDSSGDGDSTEEEATTSSSLNYDPVGWTSNWDSREKMKEMEDEDLRWWVKQPSSSRMRLSSAASIVLLASIMAFCIY